MTPFEEELRRAISRQNPPADFTARVLAAAAKDPGPHRSAEGLRQWLRGLDFWRVAAPALAALLMVSGGVMYQQHERLVQGEAAKEKLLVALRIAGSKLHQTQERISKVEAAEARQ